MRAAIRRVGNSSGVIIPKPLLAEIGAKAGDEVDMTLADGKLVLARLPRSPRAGWSDDARAIAAAAEDALLWPEFGNVDDQDLQW